MPATAIRCESTTVSTAACRMASPPQPKSFDTRQPRLQSLGQGRTVNVAGTLSGHDHDLEDAGSWTLGDGVHDYLYLEVDCRCQIDVRIHSVSPEPRVRVCRVPGPGSDQTAGNSWSLY